MLNSYLKMRRCVLRLTFFLLCTQACFAQSAESVQQQISIKPALAMATHSDDLRKTMLNLYAANPEELKKSTQVSIEEMVQWVFEGPFGWKFEAIRRLQGVEALDLVVDAQFKGDRVLALIAGLHTMLVKAYGGKTEYNFSGELLPQQMYDSARNVQIIQLKISQLNAIKPEVLLGFDDNAVPRKLLSAIVNRVDIDAALLAKQTHQVIQPLAESSLETKPWQ